MKKILLYIPSIIFNVVELIIIFSIGKCLNNSIIDMLFVFIAFEITRKISKNEMHYKDWKKCLIWSTLIFTSLFTLIKVNLTIAMIMSIFYGYILTKRADINIEALENNT